MYKSEEHSRERGREMRGYLNNVGLNFPLIFEDFPFKEFDLIVFS